MTGRRLASLTLALAVSLTLVTFGDARSRHAKTPLPRPRPQSDSVPLPRTRPFILAAVPLPLARPTGHFAHDALFSPTPLAQHATALQATIVATAAPTETAPKPPPSSAAPTASKADIDAVKRAAKLVGHDEFSKATALEKTISDPLARKLVEWMILRGDENHSPGFERYAGFVAANPNWPSIVLFRKRAEAALWDDKRDPATVLAYFATHAPLTAKGHFSYARALLARGKRADAEQQVRQAWQHDTFSSAVESEVLSEFPHVVRHEDDRARMHRMLFLHEFDAGLRAAHRLGAADRAIAKAWAAVDHRSRHAKALLDAVPESARHDVGYIFARARWLRHEDKITDAAKEILGGPSDAKDIADTNAWWIENRLIARKLLDIGNPQLAYRVATHAVPPQRDNFQVYREFTAGWIALRFLHEPAEAMKHFRAIAAGTSNRTALARAGYWEGRTAAALGHASQARVYYRAAARYRTTYYGQLARARLGDSDLTVPSPPTPSASERVVLSHLDVVRALKLVYAAGVRDFAIPIVADVAPRTDNVGVLVALAEIAQHNRDARAMMLIGNAALHDGYSFEHYAFPAIGIPHYHPIGPTVARSILYSIVRQESAFDPTTVSSAKAYGLMQVTAEAARDTARRFKVHFNRKKLLDDIAYNVQMGAAELGELLRQYNGSYILAFVGYNAGRGRVRDWIKRYGDPRSPKVDPVDWVEKIPFSETRNYVQRILENLQIYRARFGATKKLKIEADLHRGTEEN